MHFLVFHSDYILYMFPIGKLFIFRLYMQFMVCIMHSCGLAATDLLGRAAEIWFQCGRVLLCCVVLYCIVL